MFQHTLGGTPFYVTLVVSVAFLAYGVLRRVPAAWDLLSTALVVLAVVGPRSLDLDELVPLRPLPLAMAGFVLGSEAWRRRHSFRAFVAGFLLAVAGARASMFIWPSADWAMIGLQFLIMSWMAVGACFDDEMGQFARSCACAGLLALGAGSAFHFPLIVNSLPAQVVPWYPPAIATLSFAYGRLVRDRRYFATAVATAAAWAAHSGMQSYNGLRRVLVGLDQIVCGLLFFVVAAAISLKKAGVWPHSPARWIAWLVKTRALCLGSSGHSHRA